MIGLYPETTSFYRATVESGPDATSEKTKVSSMSLRCELRLMPWV